MEYMLFIHSDDDASDPARVWTTIATGQPARVHNVQSLETRRVAGIAGTVTASERSTVARAIGGATDLLRLTRPSVASGNERFAKTFWEVAASAGLRTVVVNWWATWPASANAGVVITDRATLRLERGGALDAELSPPELYEALRQQWTETRSRAEARAAASLDFKGDDATAKILRRSAELDAMQLELLTHVSTPAPDLSAVYLPGLDIAQLHGKETPGDYPPGARVWKAWRVSGSFDPAERGDPAAEAVLLDGPATGVSFDWTMAAHWNGKVIVAGGLDESNVREAIERARPWGVDASSRLEYAPGKKDHIKLERFLKAALQ